MSVFEFTLNFLHQTARTNGSVDTKNKGNDAVKVVHLLT